MQECLTFSGGKIHQKNWGPKFGPKLPKSVPKLGFCHFLKFSALFFLEIAYSDSLQQCITSSKGKTYKNVWGSGLGQNESKLFSQVWFIIFPWIEYSDSLQQWLTSSRGKTHDKDFWGPNWGQNKSCPKLVFCYFLKFGSLVFL